MFYFDLFPQWQSIPWHYYYRIIFTTMLTILYTQILTSTIKDHERARKEIHVHTKIHENLCYMSVRSWTYSWEDNLLVYPYLHTHTGSFETLYLTAISCCSNKWVSSSSHCIFQCMLGSFFYRKVPWDLLFIHLTFCVITRCK